MADHDETSPMGLDSSRPRKRMRKGTHCCTECRRRKMKCVFDSGSLECAPCRRRGSRCVDQRDVPDDSPAVSTPRTRAGRPGLPRSSRPRASGAPEIPPQSVTNNAARNTRNEASDLDMASNEDDPQPPLLAAFDTADPSSWSRRRRRDASSGLPTIPDSINTSKRLTALSERRIEACRVLRATLPSYDAIIATLSSRNGAWWRSFRQKTQVVTQAAPIEPLLKFAARAYTSSSPAELGTLAVAYARSLNNGRTFYAEVDRVVISDFAFAATLEGLECLVLLAKTYTDLGQPRRAWFTWRRGLAIAQMMGIYRVSLSTPASHQRIWWAIYHGDRFTSLLLGLPCGFNDSYIDTSFISRSDSPGAWLHRFVHDAAVLAGKTIERNVAVGGPASLDSLPLAQELIRLKHSAPESWWEIPADLPSNGPLPDQLIERLLMHFFYFHIAMYIHLPAMANYKDGGSLLGIHSSECVGAAREMLRRYLLLRSKVGEVYLFDCKTSDFVAFTAGVVLSLQVSKGMHPWPNDGRLLSSVIEIFSGLERDEACEVAAQCRTTLDLLLDQVSRPGQGTREVRIPCFGIIRVGPVSPHPLLADTRTPAAATYEGVLDTSIPTPSLTAVSSMDELDVISSTGHLPLEYLGYPDPGFGEGEKEHFLSFADDDLPIWLDTASLDLTNDWDLF